ncbi:MAG: ROK family protein, partial [Clostridia bacterium]|nr:ROK family protein [Clostridia bacterium]
LTTEQISKLALSGDQIAKECFDVAGFHIGKAISNAVNLLNVKTIILGGGVSNAFSLLEPSINDGLNKYLFHSANKKVIIKRTKLGYNAAFIGCVALILQKTSKGENYEK